MLTIEIPYSGRLLVSHLAAYGAALALDAHGVEAFVATDATSLELTPLVRANCELATVAEAVAESARQCECVVEANVEAGQGNDGIPAIRARATGEVRALASLRTRERLLDELEEGEARLPSQLIAGLGAPAVWLHEKDKATPSRGATSLDGVPYNIHSDIVRGALRHSLPRAKNLTREQLQRVIDRADAAEGDEDRQRWSPLGTRVAYAWQWLAAVGLGLLPVGLQSNAAARTPASIARSGARGISLPLLDSPTSVPRLRALLQLQELIDDVDLAPGGRLRAYGVRELVTFPRHDASSNTMVSWSFGLGQRREL